MSSPALNTNDSTVLLFGPLSPSLSQSDLAVLRTMIISSPHHAWIERVLISLSVQYPLLATEFPVLFDTAGRPHVDSLVNWLKTGDLDLSTEHLPNSLLAPLVVISQLVQYRTYLENQRTNGGQPQVTEPVGFCIGLLSAFAVSLPHGSKGEIFEQNAAVAVRLAVLSGAVVDKQQSNDIRGSSTTLSVAWKRIPHAGDKRKDLMLLLEEFPDAYISVSYDTTRVSLTTTNSASKSLQQALKHAGFSVTELGLSGRFHSELDHLDGFNSILEFCEKNRAFTYPANIDGNKKVSNEESPHILALRSILLQKCEWYDTILALKSSHLSGPSSRLISFGERCIPSSLLSDLAGRTLYSDDITPQSPSSRENANDVAVIGMSINIAGASSVPDFWDLLASGKSQHKLVPEDRFNFETVFRENDDSRKWYGNFIEGIEEFDHKFFKRTPRESQSMDPQQRLLLQCAYQAVEMAGYFNNIYSDIGELITDRQNIGCYIGMCGNDYTTNSNHHAPNAFTATGTLRSFVAGKLSHYFGWLGPSLTLDTACSASAVAIHSACRAIVSGEVIAALAGGTNTISEPGIYQNLAGASFLSPTGACKPFDAQADGYCRGEAVSAVFLKSLSQARKDGDVILGVIAGTSVAQNSNDTPIVVPNASSLSTLFSSVLKTAKLDAQDVSVVEAHGTGTPVGDPAEYAAIRRIFGQEKDNGIKRATPLQLGSVKGLVGHTEGCSGAVSLIKVLCMLHEATIAPQASHTHINPAIGATTNDGIQISTQLKPWDANFKAALINNYGASGSNASMVVMQKPASKMKSNKTCLDDSDTRYPFWLTGLDDRSLRAYAVKLRNQLKQKPNTRISDLSFNLSRQSNRTLLRALFLSARSTSDLVDKLTQLDSVAMASVDVPISRPVIMCFGGQLSTTIGLDRAIFDNTSTPIPDIVLLQTALFALQYSTARCWIDCGISPVAVTGHSFGELTAMCISGALGLKDAMKLIVGRATVIRDSWGAEKGSMVVVEGTEDEVLNILKTLGHGFDASIACYNSPRSHTVAGSLHSIDAVVEIVSTKYPELRFKRLAVSNAFHSSLVAPLRSKLQRIGKELTFNSPRIPIERAVKDETLSGLGEDTIADHLQSPVYFSHAVHRLAQKYPSAIWLEAGSNATITSMAGKALNMPTTHHFQAVNISGTQGLQRLVDTTLSLWKTGLRFAYWGHSRAQTEAYNTIILPPYQFEKKKHWLDFKSPPKFTATLVENTSEMPTKLFTFTGYQDSKQRLARFGINTMTPEYQEIVAGHTIAGAASICPATVQIDITIEALMSISKHLTDNSFKPQIRSIVNTVPVCVDASRSVWLEVEALDPSRMTWSWKWVSTGPSGAASTTHVIGEIQFRHSSDIHYQNEFSRYERLVSHRRCLEILHSENPDEVLQGRRSIYRVFSPIVAYSPLYFGLQKLVGQGSESAGRIVKKHSGDSWLDAFLSDAFCQVAGIWVNCMTEGNEEDMWIANGIEQWIRSPTTTTPETCSIEKWHVFGQHSRSVNGTTILSDVFVFDAATGLLQEAILGIKYARVSKSSMGKLIFRLTGEEVGAMKAPVVKSVPPVLMASAELPPTSMVASEPHNLKADLETDTTSKNIIKRLKAILADLSGLELDEIKDNCELADIGVDSLMGMEMAREVEKEFKCTLPQNELAHVTDFPSLLRCLESALGVSINSADLSSASSSSDDAEEDTDGSTTPLSVPDDAPLHPFDLKLPQSAIVKAFSESKLQTDRLMEKYGVRSYLNTIAPQQDQLCVALTVEAFKNLGCDLSAAKPDQELPFVPHAGDQKKFAQYLYTVLEKARLVNLDNRIIVRTHIPVPTAASSDLLRNLLDRYPEHACCNELAYWTGSHLAEILTGQEDGIKLIFGTERGRELVGAVYADFPINKLYYEQMGDFLRRLALSACQIPGQGPLKILEMGAGTGATTKSLIPLLAGLGVNVEYTFTDLAPSFVAAARKTFKQYPFMKFRVHDIEKPPAEDLLQSQHVVIASNAVHATRSLPVSTTNIKKMLRPDGVLLLLEMTEPMYWCDIVFGVFEGWWLFEDDRQHAVAPPQTWEKALHSVGYGHVDWSEGHVEEVRCERLIMATAGGQQLERAPLPAALMQSQDDSRHDERRKATDKLIQEVTADFAIPTAADFEAVGTASKHCIIITGATGSLGSHMVAHYTNLPWVSSVVCFNRRSNSSNLDPLARQLASLTSRGINLSSQSLAKVSAFEVDIAKPYFGLSSESYNSLVDTVTHVVHNAWPMNAKQPLSAFIPQFRVLRRLIDFSALASARRGSDFKFSFQFISSIATVGHYPIATGASHIPEQRMRIEYVLPNGYGDAKFVCERILDETLHRHPSRFNTTVVRLGQVAGSSVSGYWNENEHLPFLIKSSQTLRVLPQFDGPMSWTPVDSVAGVCADLVFNNARGFYHVDNPIRQPWRAMMPLLAAELSIPASNIIPFKEWIHRVRAFPSTTIAGKDDLNPAKRLVDFLEADFERMSCGGVLLETERSRRDSETMRKVGPVEEVTVRKYIQSWRMRGFLV